MADAVKTASELEMLQKRIIKLSECGYRLSMIVKDKRGLYLGESDNQPKDEICGQKAGVFGEIHQMLSDLEKFIEEATIYVNII